MKYILISVILTSLGLPIPVSAQSAPTGKIYNITDEAINGFAYDPTCPNTPVEVHIYHGDKWANGADRPTICTAKYSCVWPGICQDSNSNGQFGDDGKGFWCTPRHPLASDMVTDPNKLNNKIAVVSKCRPNAVTWLNTTNQSPSIIRTVVQNRTNDTIFVEKPLYKIGVSKRFGGAVVEYYNKNGSPDDATINLIKPAAGESLQTTVFGKNPIASGVDCFGTLGGEAFGVQGPVYNPTQTGSYCGIPNPSQVETCYANDQPISCNSLLSNPPAKMGFKVHYRNFTYPQQSSEAKYREYKSYDDVWGRIDYTFTDNYVQIDYDIQKNGPTSYGRAISQFPIAFLNHLTRFTYQQDGQIKTTTPTITNVVKFPITDNDDGRWFTSTNASFTASDNSQILPEPQSTFMTMSLYSGKVDNICQPRYLQINNVPFGFGNTYLSQVETTTVAAQNYLEFEIKKDNHVRARAFMFPYRYSDTLPGTTLPLHQLLGKSESQAGFVPSWECNFTQPAKLGDLNNDNRVDNVDLPLFLSAFTANSSTADLTADSLINLFDYNVFVSSFTN